MWLERRSYFPVPRRSRSGQHGTLFSIHLAHRECLQALPTKKDCRKKDCRNTQLHTSDLVFFFLPIILTTVLYSAIAVTLRKQENVNLRVRSIDPIPE